MAGARHFVCRRVFAPHLGALFGLPGGLSFFSHPHPFLGLDVGSFLLIILFPLIDLIVVLAHLPHNCLSTLVHVHVLHSHFLFEFTPITAQGFCKVGKYPQKFRGPIDEHLDTQIGLPIESSTCTNCRIVIDLVLA